MQPARSWIVLIRRIGSSGRSALFSLALVVGVVLLCLPACSTIWSVGANDAYLYAGTRQNVVVISGHPHPEGTRVQVAPVFAVFDFPLSLALDTALIPIMLPLELIHHDNSSSAPPPSDDHGSPPQEVKNRDYEGWIGVPLGSWRRCQSVTPTGTVRYTDRLVVKTPYYVLLERVGDGLEGEIKLLATVVIAGNELKNRKTGMDWISIGGRPIPCTWDRWGDESRWEKRWYSTHVVGGWVKTQQRRGNDFIFEETLLEDHRAN